MLADLGTKPLASGRFLELMLGLGLHVPSPFPLKSQVKAVSLHTRPQPLDCKALDLGRIPAESKCQNLLRALLLLEVIDSLTMGEAV